MRLDRSERLLHAPPCIPKHRIHAVEVKNQSSGDANVGDGTPNVPKSGTSIQFRVEE
jgi:hypothetical protein